MGIIEALETIVENRSNKAVNYAVNYAKVALNMKRGSEAFRTQLVYVKCNIVYWRGARAKQVRKAISEELSR